VDPPRLERRGRVHPLSEGQDQRLRHRARERIAGRRTAQVLHGKCVVACGAGPVGQAGEGPHERVGEPRPPALGPPVELRRIRHVHTIEEGTGIDRHPCFEIAPIECRQELRRVAGQRDGIELERSRPRDHHLRAEGSTDSVQQLVQRVARLAGFRVGPEQTQQALACHPGRSLRREDCEQRQLAALQPQLRDSLATVGDRQPAEGLQPHDVLRNGTQWKS